MSGPIYRIAGSPTTFRSEQEAATAMALSVPFYNRGHRVFWDHHKCRYLDTGEQVKDVPTRDCPLCKLPCEVDGPDPCFGGLLPGVTQACCGHGRPVGYMKFEDGRVVAFGSVRKVSGLPE